jgi:tetratricopeptide (TPR) repeat protein
VNLQKERKDGSVRTDCGHKQPITQTIELPVDYLFYSDAFDSYYPLLAHKYHVLYGYMKEQSYFGALLEYKDVVEIVLKFPTLVAINHLWRKDDYELPEEKSILELLLGKPLSLGDWQTVCGNFIKLYNGTAPEYIGIAAMLKPLLEAVNKFYDKGLIVHWRNETIGHGALQTNLESNSEFISEFTVRLKALKTHLASNRHLYDQLEVLDSLGRLLRGKDCEEHIIGDMLKVRLGAVEYDQTPFVLVKEQTTNIFDSCIKDSVYLLNYITGKKVKQRYDLADVFAEKRKVYIKNKDVDELGKSTSKLTDIVFPSEMIDILSKMADEKETFTNPEYIIGDIKRFLAGNDKGVLFLQMERGMGKTTLVRAMDQLAMGNVYLDDGQNNMAVRAYYINNMFSYQINRFQNESVFILHNTKNFNIERMSQSNISVNFINVKDMAAEFARFLNDVLVHVYQQQTSARKLLFIIDGLDEIRYDDKRTIFDCIPHSEKLADGVYIILTGRHKSEVAPWIREKYALVEGKSVSTISYYCTNEHNRNTLENYLARQLYKKTPVETLHEEIDIINAIIEKGGHRFLYVKALRELLKADTFDIDEISDESILERYLNVLERKYGKGKHYEKIKRLLLITALLDEPASMEELSYLYSLESADFKFIGYLTDLKGLLRIDRTGTGETISASVGAMHEDWKRYLIDRNKDIVKDIIAGWIGEIKEKTVRYSNFHKFKVIIDRGHGEFMDATDGESYLVANIYSLAEAYFPESKDFFSDENVRDFLSDFMLNSNRDNTIIGITRGEKIFTGIISSIGTQTETINEANLASYCKKRGLLREELKNLDGAIADYDKYVEILERLRGEGKLRDESDLAWAYNVRGLAYKLLAEHRKAIADFDRCVEILERLRGEGKLRDESDLAWVYKARGDIYDSMKEHGKAMADYGSCVEIRERLRDAGKLCKIRSELFLLDDWNCQAMDYLRWGDIYWVMKKPEKALEEYGQCVNTLERLRGMGKLLDENDLAGAYEKRAFIYDSIKKYRKAIEDCDRCIEIRGRLRGMGKLLDENDLAGAYEKRAFIYDSMKEHGKAIEDYDRCIEIRGRLRGRGKLLNENDLVMAYIFRGAAYNSIKEYGKAVADFGSCVEIRERLHSRGELPDENDLAATYMYRGASYDSMEEYGKAIEDLNRCVEIRERLRVEDELLDENDLAAAYMYRGTTYRSMKEYGKAVADFGRCVEIRERLRRWDELLDENDLVMAS